MALDLAPIIRREKAATEPPWVNYDRMDGDCGRPCTPNGCHESHPTGARMLDVEDDTHAETLSVEYPIEFARVEDAEFAAHARQDVRDLIKEVERLTAERDAVINAYIIEQIPGQWCGRLPDGGFFYSISRDSVVNTIRKDVGLRPTTES